MRKAQGMSLKVVIIAVLVLVIMVVLIMIFSGKLKFFGGQTTETSAKYGSDRCQIPGTSNECAYTKQDCESKGGTFMEKADGYSDCFGSQCCYM